MASSEQPAPLPQWLVTLIGMAVAVGVSWGVNGARMDALADRLARVENQQLTMTVEMARVARLEERLAAMASTLNEIRNELRSHDQSRARVTKQ